MRVYFEFLCVGTCTRVPFIQLCKYYNVNVMLFKVIVSLPIN